MVAPMRVSREVRVQFEAALNELRTEVIDLIMAEAAS
jgi:hypothetical protein